MMVFKNIFDIQFYVIIMIAMRLGANCLEIVASIFECDPECKNHGTCQWITNQCQCPTGFEGPTCEIPSVGLCSDNNPSNNQSLFLITFGSGSNLYSDNTPSTFDFTTTHTQIFESSSETGQFGFINKIPYKLFTTWHTGALDYTENDSDGYMYFVDVAGKDSVIFRRSVNDLCIGSTYEFSAYLANVVGTGAAGMLATDPNIRFEVRMTTPRDGILAQRSTKNIPRQDRMTWSKYGLSFVASTSSVVLLMISNVDANLGNDIAIDDIELRVCSTANSVCPSITTSTKSNTHSPSPTITTSKTAEISLPVKTTPNPVTTTKIMTPTASVTLVTTIEPTATVRYIDVTTISTTDTTQTSTTTKSQNKGEQRSPFFTPKQCNDSSYIGPNCDVPRSPCDKSNPCLNNGTCHTNNTVRLGYNCLCTPGFTGSLCETDDRPCKPYTCLNHGICNETSNTTYACICYDGWEGSNCELMINFCTNNPCTTNGICRPILLNYTCECLSNSYSGRYCEIVATKLVIYRIVSKSFAYVAIIVLVSAGMFIVIMDILKYCFGIDPVEEERKRMRRNKQMKKKKPPVIQRPIYIDAPLKTTKI